VAERGATPDLPRPQRVLLRALKAFSSPLQLDDYLELVNPLWSTRELRGRIERIERETDDASTIVIKPAWRWVGHDPGQYLRIGLQIDGKLHWRAYSISSDPGRPDRHITITVKKVDEGQVSPYLNSDEAQGAIVRLGGVEGQFVLPDPLPEKVLFLTGGSGVTPVMAMLRHLDREDRIGDVVMVHSADREHELIFKDELEAIAKRHPSMQLKLLATLTDGRIEPDRLDELCPDWREREAYVCGPEGMLVATEEHWEAEGLSEHYHSERFASQVGGGEQGDGGTITLVRSEIEAESDGSKTILDAGEEAGASLPYGCRMGICHTCQGRLRSGQVRDLRTGEVFGEEGEIIQTCITAPEGPVEIDL
jgi:stearoyl-CoA 9-desaturase NADPH oxidoreductase